jgi:hypothetical protein
MTIKTLFGALALAATLSSTSNAWAADTETTTDVRCLVVGALLASNNDANAKSAGLLAGLYYLGRLDGHDPGIDLAKAVTDEALKLKPSDVPDLAKTCGAIMMGRGKALSAAGEALKDRAADLAKPRT